jgi:hypothetical protein
MQAAQQPQPTGNLSPYRRNNSNNQFNSNNSNMSGRLTRVNSNASSMRDFREIRETKTTKLRKKYTKQLIDRQNQFLPNGQQGGRDYYEDEEGYYYYENDDDDDDDEDDHRSVSTHSVSTSSLSRFPSIASQLSSLSLRSQLPYTTEEQFERQLKKEEERREKRYLVYRAAVLFIS